MPPVIIYEDAWLLAVDKPAGQAAIPGEGHDRAHTLLAELEAYTGAKVFVVHRLDRETSGLLLYAKDAATHRALNLQFEHRTVRKRYLALVQGQVAADQGVMDGAIREFGSGRMGVSPTGKPSLTRYTVQARLAGTTLLALAPETGRRHQLRVHLYALGHPVMGDPVYGRERPVGGAPRLMLHAAELAFDHPAGDRRTFAVAPGADWDAVLAGYPPVPGGAT